MRLSIEKTIELYGDEILKGSMGRRQLAGWLNDKHPHHPRYTEHFARRVLDEMNERGMFERKETVVQGQMQQYGNLRVSFPNQGWGDKTQTVSSSVKLEKTQDESVEDKLRRIYGIQDKSWVPVSVWGEPHAPRAKWERKPLSVSPEEFSGHIPRIKLDAYPFEFPKDAFDQPRIGVLSIRDTHFGMFTDFPEPYESYDLEEAQAAYIEAGRYLIARAKEAGVKYLVIPYGSDMLHVDNHMNTTTKGTPQDVTSIWWHAFDTALASLSEVIALAVPLFEDVILVLEQGNHDRNMSMALGFALAAEWSGQVTILHSPETIKHVKFGDTYLFFYHGDGIKPEAYPSLIFDQHPETARAGAYTEILTGHMHHRRKTVLSAAGDYHEAGNLVFRVTPALCPSSNWAESMGYRSMPGAQLTVYDRTGFDAMFDWTPLKQNG